MKLTELKNKIDVAIKQAKEYGMKPEDVFVSIQIDINEESIWSSDVELYYDGDGCASGCVLVGVLIK